MAKATPAPRRKPARKRERAPRVDEQMRHAMTAQAAYFRAEHRGFREGGALDDWLEAEREIGRMLDT